ncbi:hypothetical protein SAMN04488123_1371 [Natribacillus halophilus]|uniref:Uncharacterized protein n=1 Tax=Natribacillus halophilus TaxID=549003 RepID=A0A1G8RKI5_9BACI|nr:hypothetical protein SAMN04488123_11856 [Natribacillus halophilus]SDJ33082.1 hypothetical protein SAMN04488123_1371 [Natribacillus halophilus]
MRGGRGTTQENLYQIWFEMFYIDFILQYCYYNYYKEKVSKKAQKYTLF